MPSIRSTEGFSSTTSIICAHRWLFTSETVIVFHHAYLYLVELKYHLQKGPHREIHLQCQYTPLALPPLLEILKPETSDVTTLKHVAFADDLGGAGDLLELRRWWDNIVNCGPKLGYNPNASKSWLIVKPEVQTKAREIFRGTKINITTEGRKYLGGYIGSEDGWDEYADELVNS